MGASDAEDILNGLTEDERKLALSILGEYGETGESKTMDGLLRADYSEVPVDIETFLTDDRYLGRAWRDASGKSKIYPFWMDTLKKIFPNNLDTAYDTLLESGARGLGKAQPIDSPVLTDNGFSPMGEVHIGTKVYGADGKLHNVIGVFPQGNKPVYRVTFSDGKSTLCSDEHLWKVYHINGHGAESVKTLNEIIESGLTTNRDKSGKFGYKYKIPMCSPIDFAEQSHFIDPYVLGCLLGDGGLSTQTVKFTSPDEEIVCAIDDKLIEHGYKLAKYSADYSYGIRRIEHKNSPNEYAEEIRRLGLRCKSDRKHVPDEYLFDSVQNRLSLLQGLVDTDGYVDKGGYCVITTTSEKLKDGIVFLVESLGGTAPVRTKRSNHYKTTDGDLKHCLDSYDVSVNLPKGVCPTRLRRKAGRLLATKHQPSRTIRKAEFVGEMPCQCILVDGDEHLYLTDDFIVTHNSEIACGAVGAYLMYRIMCLKNPLEYYHLKPTEKIIFAFMNITKEASKKIAIDKFQKTVQMSPWFTARGSMTQFENNPFWVPPAPLQIVIGSQSSDVIGLPVMFAFFDEISFIRNMDIQVQKKKATDMIDTAIGGMKTRFIHDGKNPTLLVVASSKRSEQSFMETYIKSLKEIKGDKTLIVDEPVWNVKPKGTYSDDIFYIGLGNKHLESVVIPDGADIEQYRKRGYELIEVPVDFKEDARKDLNRTLCDFAGISSFSSNKFMSAEAVSGCVLDEVKNPMPDVIEVGNGSDDKSEYKDFFRMDKVDKRYMGKPLFIHLDMSLSGDKTGIAGVWIIGKKPTSDGNPGKDLWFQPAFSFSVKAPYGHQVSFAKNRNFIRWLKENGFRVKKITSDTFQSAQLQQELKGDGYDCSILSVDRVEQVPGEHTGICRPYEYLKSAIYEKRVRLYGFPDAKRTYLLYDELVQLEKNNGNGRIDHPDNGKTGSKDQSDALCGAVYTASQFADEYAYDYGEDLSLTIDTNSSVGKEQAKVDFEEELRKAFEPRSMTQQSQQSRQEPPSAFVADGCLIW